MVDDELDLNSRLRDFIESVAEAMGLEVTAHVDDTVDIHVATVEEAKNALEGKAAGGETRQG